MHNKRLAIKKKKSTSVECLSEETLSSEQRSGPFMSAAVPLFRGVTKSTRSNLRYEGLDGGGRRKAASGLQLSWGFISSRPFRSTSGYCQIIDHPLIWVTDCASLSPQTDSYCLQHTGKHHIKNGDYLQNVCGDGPAWRFSKRNGCVPIKVRTCFQLLYKWPSFPED